MIELIVTFQQHYIIKHILFESIRADYYLVLNLALLFLTIRNIICKIISRPSSFGNKIKLFLQLIDF